MSMYAQLLAVALASDDHAERTADTDELVAKVARARCRLPADPTPAAVSGDVPAAVADQLAYDMALIALCRHLGIDCDVGAFNRPDAARSRLERALTSSGLLPEGPAERLDE